MATISIDYRDVVVQDGDELVIRLSMSAEFNVIRNENRQLLRALKSLDELRMSQDEEIAELRRQLADAKR